jgi:hypothetical protein
MTAEIKVNVAITAHIAPLQLDVLIRDYFEKTHPTYKVKTINYKVKNGYNGDWRDQGYPASFQGIDVQLEPKG